MRSTRLLVLITIALLSAQIARAAEIKTIICIQFERDASKVLKRDSKGFAHSPTGFTELDRVLLDYNIDSIEPQFSFDPISLANPEFAALGMDQFYLLRLPQETPESNCEALRTQLGALKAIQAIWFADLQTIEYTPTDWNLSNRDMWFLDAINAREAWDFQRGSASILAVTIDTGVDFYHPDLVSNILINSAEDINHDGRFTAADLNNIDEDGNGYADDVIGYDFVSVTLGTGQYPAINEDYGPRDATPYDVQGHGTHVAGSIAAVTDNGTGVPSSSFNVKTLALRAGYAWLDSPSATSAHGSGNDIDFIPAIQYAVNRGARIISISFGGTGTNPAYQTAISYARNNNCLVLAAAGNENTSTPSYPAAYNGVMAVAALDRGYTRASFSNYGNWVDIAAPGVDIWSTMVVNAYHPQPYVAQQGTSMACPTAAAVAALTLSNNPSLTDDQLEARLLSNTRNIDAQNPSYVGQLGAGCVNAVMCVTTPIYRLDESFEGSFPPPGWSSNPASGAGAWAQNSGATYGPGNSAYGNYCAMFNAYDYASGVTGDLTSPSFSLVGLQNPTLIFAWSNYDEWFLVDADIGVYITTNNGTNWTLLGTYLGDANQWYESGISLAAYANQSNVRVSFYIQSDFGSYNIFVDRVRIVGLTDVEERVPSVSTPTGFALSPNFPNPFNATTTIKYSVAKSAKIELAVFDITGREVGKIVDFHQERGNIP